MTERVQSQLQGVEMGFLQRVHCVTLGDQVRFCEIHKALHIGPFLQIEKPQLQLFGLMTRMPQKRLAR